MLVLLLSINILFLVLSTFFIYHKKNDIWWFYLPIFIYNLFYTGYVVFPVFFGYLLGFSIEQFLIPEEQISISFAMHLLFYTLFLFGYLFNKPVLFRIKLFEKKLPNFVSWALCAVIIIVGLVKLPSAFIENYGEHQSLLLEEFSITSGDNIVYYPNQFFYSTLVFLVVFSYKNMGSYKNNYNYLFYISLTIFFIVTLLSILSGKRQFIFNIFMLFFFYFSLLISKKKSFKFLFLSIMILIEI